MTIRDSVLATRIASHLRVNTSFYTKLVFLSGCSRRAHTTINHPSFFWCLLFVFGTLDYHHYLLLNSFFLFFPCNCYLSLSSVALSESSKVFEQELGMFWASFNFFLFLQSSVGGLDLACINKSGEKSWRFFFFWTLFSNVYRLLWALLHLYKFITINICHFHVHHCHYMY